ncbi:MAG: hypothetical protein LBB39_01415 [Mycoplasmataceae bacterium]|nr:hypothetical protein [Mycoplasmataceae bacterium]
MKIHQLLLPFSFLPLLLSSCGQNDIFSKIKNRVIDPSYLEIQNDMGGSFNTFNHLNDWSSGNTIINNSLNTPFTYKDRFESFQGGLIIDENDQKQRNDLTYSDKAGWFPSNDPAPSYFDAESKKFTSIFRDGTGTSHFTTQSNTGSDNIKRVKWTSYDGANVHPIFPTQFNPDLTKEYYACPQDLINEIIIAVDPYNFSSDAASFWTDEVMGYGGDVVSFLQQICGINGTDSPFYNANFDAYRMNKEDSIKLTDQQKIVKTAFAQINLAILTTALIDGTFQVYNPVDKTLTHLRLSNGEGSPKYDKIKIYQLDSSFTPSLTDYTIPNPTNLSDEKQKADFGLDTDFSNYQLCNFIKIGIGKDSYESQNNMAIPSVNVSNIDPLNNPWFIQLDLGDVPKPYLCEIFDSSFIGILPDRAIDFLHPTTSGNNYGSLVNYKDSLFNGPYAIKRYIIDQYIDLALKDDYALLSPNTINGSIKKIRFWLYKNKTGADEGYLFQSNNLSYFYVTPSNPSAWDQFIGDDYDKPKFDYMSYTLNSDSLFSFILFYNYLYGTSLENCDFNNEKNACFLLPSVRAYISFMLNKSWYGYCFTRHSDDTVGNVFDKLKYNKDTDGFSFSIAGTNFTVRGDAYQDIAADQIMTDGTGFFKKAMSLINDANTEMAKPTAAQLNSYAQYYHSHAHAGKKDWTRFNFFIGMNAWIDWTTESISLPTGSDLDSFKSFMSAFKDWCDAGFGESADASKKIDAVDKAVRALNTKVSSDLNNVFGKNQVNPDFLVSGSTLMTTLPYTRKMIESIQNYQFANGSYNTNAPIQFSLNISVSDTDFKTKRNSKQISSILNGWSPDYSDPLNTLITYNYGGFYDQIIMNIANLKKIYAANESSSAKKPINEKLKPYYQKLFTIMDKFNEALELAKRETNEENDGVKDARYKAFSSAECDVLYKYNILCPLDMKGASEYPIVTYINNESRKYSNQSNNFFIYDQSKQLRTTHENHIQTIFRDFIVENENKAASLTPENFSKFVNGDGATKLPAWNPKWGTAPTWADFAAKYSGEGGKVKSTFNWIY